MEINHPVTLEQIFTHTRARSRRTRPQSRGPGGGRYDFMTIRVRPPRRWRAARRCFKKGGARQVKSKADRRWRAHSTADAAAFREGTSGSTPQQVIAGRHAADRPAIHRAARMIRRGSLGRCRSVRSGWKRFPRMLPGRKNIATKRFQRSGSAPARNCDGKVLVYATDLLGPRHFVPLS